MLHERTDDEVRVLFAYADRERLRQSGPALILFGERGSVSAGIFIDHPRAEGRDGYHGPPPEHLERLHYRAAYPQPHEPPRASGGWGY